MLTHIIHQNFGVLSNVTSDKGGYAVDCTAMAYVRTNKGFAPLALSIVDADTAADAVRAAISNKKPVIFRAVNEATGKLDMSHSMDLDTGSFIYRHWAKRIPNLDSTNIIMVAEEVITPMGGKPQIYALGQCHEEPYEVVGRALRDAYVQDFLWDSWLKPIYQWGVDIGRIRSALGKGFNIHVIDVDNIEDKPNFQDFIGSQLSLGKFTLGGA